MKIGITFSTFDLFHAGHVKMLEEAKRQCDYLIVGLQLDPSFDRPEKNGPSQTIIERYIQLKGSKHIDEIVPYVSEQDLEDILRSFKLDVRIIGDEYKEKNFTEYYNLIYQFQNDCLTAAIEYNKEYYSDQDLKPSENLFFKLSILPFGGFNTPNLK